MLDIGPAPVLAAAVALRFKPIFLVASQMILARPLEKQIAALFHHFVKEVMLARDSKTL